MRCHRRSSLVCAQSSYTRHIFYVKEVDINKQFKELGVKNVRRLRQHIRCTGLALARHAEEAALDRLHLRMRAKHRKAVHARKLHIIVIRANNHGELMNSKPCENCVRTLQEFGIRKVTYSTQSNGMVTQALGDLESHPSVGYRCVQQTLEILDTMLELYDYG